MREYEASMFIRSAEVTVEEVEYLPISAMSSTKLKFGFESDRVNVRSRSLIFLMLTIYILCVCILIYN
jgi:hypothetical protein